MFAVPKWNHAGRQDRGILFGNRNRENLHKEAAHTIAEAGRLRRAGESRQSEAAARDALEIDPDNGAAALACLGAALSDQGRSEEALAPTRILWRSIPTNLWYTPPWPASS
jgi:Flp pilus assembly protein TadD